MNLTFKAIVVEDEKLIRNNIIESITLCDPSFEICASATNGNDGLELIHTLKPDVLFTDIRMPIVNGLVLAEKAKQICPNIQVVIISGYAEFEYAQHAIRLGVEDYLLKPIRTDALKNILSKLKHVLQKNKHFETKQHLQKIINTESLEDLPCRLADCTNILSIVNLGNLCNYVPSTLVRSYFNSLWDEVDLGFLPSEDCEAFVFDELSPNTKFIMFSINNKDKCIELLDSLYDYFKKEFKQIKVHIYYSYYDTLKSLSTQVEDLRLVLRRQLVMDETILMEAALTDSKLPISVLGRDFKTRLINLINNEDTDLIETEITTQLDNIIKNKMPQIWIEEYIHQLLKLLQQHTTCMSEAELYHIEYTIFDKMALPLSTLNLSTNFWNSLPVMFNSSVAVENQELITEIKNYLIKNYNSNITLDDIAQKFNFTPSYIIKMYKRSTGETPMKYVIGLRIATAKQLMHDNPAMEVKQISEYVGYFDQHYFSRIFKSITGVSPSEYRESLGN